MPFSFLAELQKEFLAAHTRDQIDGAAAHGMSSFDAKIAHLMVRSASSGQISESVLPSPISARRTPRGPRCMICVIG